MLVLVMTILASACGGAASTTDPRAGRVDAAAGVRAQPTSRLDMDAIFPRGAGRDLVLANCTNCHSFAPIVLMQRTREQWATVKQAMRPRVSGLSDDDVDVIFEYLEATFNDARPAPKLPQWFLETVPW